MSPKTHSQKTRIAAWAMYDFANSSFAAIVVTFVFATYFTKGVVQGDEIRGTHLWSNAVAMTGLIVAVLSPGLGALADRTGYRKKFLLLATIGAVLGTLMLSRAMPGDIGYAMTWFVIANVGYEIGIVFCNAYLPDLASPSRIGRVSGYAWGFGYVGGVLAMVLALIMFILPENPWFGVTKENAGHVRATLLLTAVWFTVFSLPILYVFRDRTVANSRGAIVAAYRQLKQTFHEIRRYREIVKLLAARLIYNDGLVTVFAFGGIYAQGTFGFETTEIIIFGLVLNVTAGIGAFALGYLDDKIGGKNTILVSLVGLILAAILAVLATTKLQFWVAGSLLGLFVGPNQSASRSLMGRFVPHKYENEFFGFYAFSGKATAFMGPFLLGQLTLLFDSQRAGMSVVLGFFLLGGVLLMFVDEAAGMRARG